MYIWNVREMIRYVEQHGWFLVRTRGDHRQFHHPTKPGTTTIPGKLSDDLRPETSKSILKQAELNDPHR
jgi:predicted RNA binding protein YcfA (HicA-like mRNA interferase family)